MQENISECVFSEHSVHIRLLCFAVTKVTAYVKMIENG